MAVGVSADQVMGTDGIDDVFVCQRSVTDDTVYAEDTHNPQSPRGNMQDTVSTASLRSNTYNGSQLKYEIHFSEPNWIPDDILIL